MDSVGNFFRGYDKVSHLENQKITKKPVSTATTIIVVLLFIFVIALTLAALMVEPTHKGSPSLSSTNSGSSDSIRTICNVTRFPDSCFTAVSASLNASTKPDPVTVLRLSLQSAITHLSNLSSSLKSLNDLHSEPALKDCVDLFDDALSRLNDSVSAMNKVMCSGKETVLTKGKTSDVQTWISAAMTDQDTCNDGLEEMGSTVADQVKSQFQSFRESVLSSVPQAMEPNKTRSMSRNPVTEQNLCKKQRNDDGSLCTITTSSLSWLLSHDDDDLPSKKQKQELIKKKRRKDLKLAIALEEGSFPSSNAYPLS
ncbi:Pectinesterase inhibitor [Corchorus capsularis]|uniref:pectinesterase n=1 Tax=Corchorus capsularis TaxID=210143 RepID=A0A1R3JAS5_COCAP|nr:Pectinesterase inhibitor [Corchorus capsularis]